jgi:hypothetical protein
MATSSSGPTPRCRGTSPVTQGSGTGGTAPVSVGTTGRCRRTSQSGTASSASGSPVSLQGEPAAQARAVLLGELYVAGQEPEPVRAARGCAGGADAVPQLSAAAADARGRVDQRGAGAVPSPAGPGAGATRKNAGGVRPFPQKQGLTGGVPDATIEPEPRTGESGFRFRDRSYYS